MAKKIRVAIAGVGNCASALVQGINYYRTNRDDIRVKAVDNLSSKTNTSNNESGLAVNYNDQNRSNGLGLTAYNLGGYGPCDVEFVAAFDVIDSKVGKDLSEAIFAEPNNTVITSHVDN